MIEVYEQEELTDIAATYGSIGNAEVCRALQAIPQLVEDIRILQAQVATLTAERDALDREVCARPWQEWEYCDETEAKELGVSDDMQLLTRDQAAALSRISARLVKHAIGTGALRTTREEIQTSRHQYHSRPYTTKRWLRAFVESLPDDNTYWLIRHEALQALSR